MYCHPEHSEGSCRRIVRFAQNGPVLMKCQNCDAEILPSDERCWKCGAIPLRRRVFSGGRRDDFTLTAEEEPFELGDISETEDWQIGSQRRSDSDRPAIETARQSSSETQWGGFFRRTWAFGLDLIVIAALSIVMFSMCYVGYKVGLSAHGRMLTWEQSTPLLVLLTWASFGLATGYFVVFHGIGGKTIGKWLLGLRVVGAERSGISYRRAFLRWLALVGFAPVLLGSLWILWSREKRGWHDLLARTWVIRE
jgi:uncharacterized RDD family membrane protein YckC